MRAFFFAGCALLCAGAQLAPDEIIRRSVAANERDWRAGPNYSNLDRTIEKKDGEITDRTYQVVMMEGSPYRRLIAEGGQPLPAGRQRQEEQKERRELARRRSELPEERQSRIRKYQKERDQDHLLMTQMAIAFNFRLVGEETIGGCPVYVLDARPKPDYRAPTREARVLTGMKGRLWVDAEHFHWARVEAEVMHPVTFGGFLAKVGPGTRFALEKEPVGADVWQPKQFSVAVNASILFWSHNSTTVDTFSDYRTGIAVAKSGAPRAGSFQLELQGQKIEQVLQSDDRQKVSVIDHHQAAQPGSAHFR